MKVKCWLLVAEYAVELRFGQSRKRVSASEAAGTVRFVIAPDVGVVLAVVAGKAVAEVVVIVLVTVMTFPFLLRSLARALPRPPPRAAPTTTRVARAMRRPNADARSPKGLPVFEVPNSVTGCLGSCIGWTGARLSSVNLESAYLDPDFRGPVETIVVMTLGVHSENVVSVWSAKTI